MFVCVCVCVCVYSISKPENLKGQAHRDGRHCLSFVYPTYTLYVLDRGRSQKRTEGFRGHGRRKRRASATPAARRPRRRATPARPPEPGIAHHGPGQRLAQNVIDSGKSELMLVSSLAVRIGVKYAMSCPCAPGFKPGFTSART